jgi:hypothetical protein
LTDLVEHDMRTTIVISIAVIFPVLACAVISRELRRVRRTNALHEAASRHDHAQITRLLDSGTPVDQVNEDKVFGVRIRSYPYEYENGVTALYVAACRCDLKSVKLLLDRGADVNHPVASPYTILQRAVTTFFGSIDIYGTGIPPEPPEEDKLQIVRLLLNAGADVNERKYEGAETAIDMCDRMHLSEIKLLLEAKVAPPSPQTQTSN